ncbi:hypothetical protein V1227_03255 [Lentzea sp. DG1S-22]|uniref:hypothetical protein n=1 Tax=Lentzea sp. DG1S-22 TaxID=3108822 RepID=UPI002E764A82|nr:hypothetical protein [Lentzea sp. DG1S-22]WVH81788.1 hypothetical protein V1227_03255 [Lentzea sp. DG1S-22]
MPDEELGLPAVAARVPGMRVVRGAGVESEPAFGALHLLLSPTSAPGPQATADRPGRSPPKECGTPSPPVP